LRNGSIYAVHFACDCNRGIRLLVCRRVEYLVNVFDAEKSIDCDLGNILKAIC
jgi:hypothetical protein